MKPQLTRSIAASSSFTRKVLSRALLACLGLGLASAAQAVLVPAAGDTYVKLSPAGAQKSFGFELSLKVSGDSTSLLQFDLAALPPDLLVADIEKATVLLRVSVIGTPGAIDVHPVIAPSLWSEAGVSSMNRGPRIGASIPVSTGMQYVMLDVTSLMKQWIGTRGNKAPNLGLMIVPSIEAPGTTVEFDSRERGFFSPLLDVTLFLTRGGAMLHGNGMPSNDLGEDGDMYLEAVGQQLVGPKANGVWPQTFTALAGPKGEKGDVGPAGAAGSKGEAGVVGAAGTKGDVGLQGPVGATGSAGATGAKGDVGLQGSAGTTGATGATGANGAKGDVGLQGPSGATGSAGATGVAGATGAKGDVGLQGSAGATGANGAKGDVGLQGPSGTTGPAGATGVAGATGAKGDAGPQGSAGTTGATGANGAKGDAGLQGPSGATGVAGATGAKGDVGLQGSAGATGASGAKGDVGLQGPSGATGSAGASGVAGATGPQGPAGAGGPAGATGLTGNTGPQGPAGPSGSSAFQITHRSASVLSNVTAATISCLAGEVATGGGVTTAGTNLYVMWHGPVNGTGWTVRFDWNPSGATIWVICMSKI